MNNNLATERALLGVFEKCSYASVGTKESPVPYGAERGIPSHWKNKQFSIKGMQHSQKADVLDCYFDHKYQCISEGDKFVDKLRYIDSQKEKKKGFLTSDFSKRDEFSNTVRTLQWREQLTHEAKWTDKAIAAGAADAGAAVTGATPPIPSAVLYDLLHEAPPGPTSPAASKVHRDTQNKTALSRDRAYGVQTTSSRLAFPPPAIHTPPEYGHKPLISGTFFRRSGVFWS